MTDRVHSLTVVLANNVRDDDVEQLANAMLLFEGVIDVGKNVATPESYVAEQRALQKIRDRVYAALTAEGEN